MSDLETEIECMNPKVYRRWFLSLPVVAATGEDVWCACLLCGKPHGDTRNRVGKPVEYLVQLRSDRETAWRGLHLGCWLRNTAGSMLELERRNWQELADAMVGLVENSGEVTIEATGGREWEALKRRFVELEEETAKLAFSTPGELEMDEAHDEL